MEKTADPASAATRSEPLSSGLSGPLAEAPLFPAWMDGLLGRRRDPARPVSERDVAAPPRSLQARVTAVEAPTAEMRLVRLAPERSMPFLAGQFARLQFGSQLCGNFAMAGRPEDRTLEFHVPRAIAGDGLSAGGIVTIEGPFGAAHLRERPGQAIVAVASGAGCAAALSIVRTALGQGGGEPIRLYLGFDSDREVYGVDRLAALARQHRRLAWRAVVGCEGLGALHKAVSADMVSLRDAVLYVAGPAAMVESVKSMAVNRGVSRLNLFAQVLATPQCGGLLSTLQRRSRAFMAGL